MLGGCRNKTKQKYIYIYQWSPNGVYTTKKHWEMNRWEGNPRIFFIFFKLKKESYYFKKYLINGIILETCIHLYLGWWVWGYLAGKWEFYSWKEWTLGVVLVTRSCLTLFATPWSCKAPWSPPGSSVHGNSTVRLLDWVAISFSRGSSQPR